MEETDVVIVGGGPSGLTLSLALAQRRVRSMVIESNAEICEDPRAIAITGDTCRIFRTLGVTDEQFTKIGQPLTDIHFHYGSYQTRPWLVLEHTQDLLGQAMPVGIMILQPKLEQILRNLIKSSSYAQLRTNCKVIDRQEFDNTVVVTYEESNSKKCSIRSRFLIGADGKRGIVRKHFLEPSGIVQETGVDEYSGKWVAANMRVRAPTPKSHPKFPLWECGYSSQEVMDMFWPSGFHFCNDPVSPVATGRFGPSDQFLWRFEYELPTNEEPEDLISDLRTKMEEHLTLTAQHFSTGRRPSAESVVFPWDCVEVIRCRPAYFVHKVVNRWFDKRTILIGDAAHVFPPFGGQGIAGGVRDAYALSWRLSFILGTGSEITHQSAIDHVLNEWSRERRRGIDIASKATMENGNLLNNRSWLMAQIYSIAFTVLECIPLLKRYLIRTLTNDEEGYSKAKNGFFLPHYGGGSKMAQIWLRPAANDWLLPSDKLFWNPDSVLSVLIIGEAPSGSECDAVKQMISDADLPTNVLSDQIIAINFSQSPTTTSYVDNYMQNLCFEFKPCYDAELKSNEITVPSGYDPTVLLRRFKRNTRYVLVRPDFIIFSQAADLRGLEQQIRELQAMTSA